METPFGRLLTPASIWSGFGTDLGAGPSTPRMMDRQDGAMLEANERRLVDVAESIAGSLPAGEVHTVAAAAMDVNGDIHTGVNVHHFTGGPCAELVAIGAAAGAGAQPLITIVAVGDGERG